MRFLTIDAATKQFVPALLYRVFGYSYTDAWMYDADAVASASEQGTHVFMVAVDAQGAPVAMLALRFPFLGRRVGELGTLISDPLIRGADTGLALRGLLDHLAAVSQTFAAEDLRLLISSEVVVHPLSQKLAQWMDFANVGLYLGWTPVWAERERSHQRVGMRRPSDTGGRRSELVSAYPFSLMLQPYTVAMPASLLSILGPLREQFPRLPARWVKPQPLPASGRFETSFEHSRNRAVLRVLEPGQDLVDPMLNATAHYRDGLVDILHLQIPMRQFDLEPLIAPLLSVGYRFAAWLPAFEPDGDLLVLQLIHGEIAPVRARQILSSEGRRLLAAIWPDADRS